MISGVVGAATRRRQRRQRHGRVVRVSAGVFRMTERVVVTTEPRS